MGQPQFNEVCIAVGHRRAPESNVKACRSAAWAHCCHRLLDVATPQLDKGAAFFRRAAAMFLGFCLGVSMVLCPPWDEPARPRTDIYGDPLPPAALARFGTLRFRHGGLSSMVLLPDGKTVLTAGTDRMLRYWDLATGRPTKVVQLRGTVGPGYDVTLSPDGKTLVAHLGQTQLLQFWDVASATELKSLPAPADGFRILSFSPDGKTLAVGSDMGPVRVSLWDWRAGTQRVLQMPRLAGNNSYDSTYHGSFSADGKWFIASLGEHAPLGMFDVATGQEVKRFSCEPCSSKFAPDGKRLAVCSTPRANGRLTVAVRLLELADARETTIVSFNHLGWFGSLAFAPKGNLLACTSSACSCVLEVATGRVLFQLPRLGAAVFSADGATLVAHDGHRLRVWDVATGRERGERPGDFDASILVALSPDGKCLAACHLLHGVDVWDAANGRLLQHWPLGVNEGFVRDLAFSADSRKLAAALQSGRLYTWNVPADKLEKTVRLREPNNESESGFTFIGQRVAPDEKWAHSLDAVYRITTGRMLRLSKWNAETGDLVLRRMVPAEEATWATYLPEAAWLPDAQAAIVQMDGSLTLLELATGATRLTFAGRAGDGPLVLSPSGRLLAARKAPGPGGKASNADLVLWETATGKQVATVNTNGLAHWAMTPDDRCLVTAEFGVVIVRDVATGKERLRYLLPESELGSVGRCWVSLLLLSRDGRTAFTVLTDGSALAWDLTPARHSPKPLVPNVGEAELAAWWTDLGKDDVGKAWQALWGMTETPQAVDFMGGRLKAIAAPEAAIVRRWIAELDSEVFVTRQQAQTELAAVAELIEPLMRETLKDNVSLEVRRRLTLILEQVQNRSATGDELRQVRAVAALELINTPQARKLLAQLATGAAGARQTREARMALRRLAMRRGEEGDSSQNLLETKGL
jgi:WD40 repeat protein